jgi:hypothetical protein
VPDTNKQHDWTWNNNNNKSCFLYFLAVVKTEIEIPILVV